MAAIGLILLVFCAALAGLIFASNYYMRFWIKKFVTQKMEWLDFIQDTAMAPIEWRKRHDKKLAKIPASNDARRRKIDRKAVKIYLKRLDKLIYFAKICTLIQDEAERTVIVGNLEKIHKEWEAGDGAAL